jgi:dolichol-phosphate mannosyltransferase
MELAWKRQFDMNQIEVSIVIPAYYEEESIGNTLQGLARISELNLEVLVIVDDQKDPTVQAVMNITEKPRNTRVLINCYGNGPANAIKFGLDNSSARCVIVMMADGSDDSTAIVDLASLVNRGVAVACASRYMSGGQQIGGPRLKKLLSKWAGLLLHIFAGVGTHDPTNSFKGYSRDFLDSISIESSHGFEMGIELIAKARRRRLPIAEIPTIWIDRTQGESKFQTAKWIPKYLRWFLHSFGPTKRNETK